MAHDTSAGERISPVPRPGRSGVVAMASRFGRLLARELMRRKTRAALQALDNHLLKDIGISRGAIDRIARDAAGERRIADRAGRPSFPTSQPNPTQPKEKRHDVQDCFTPKTCGRCHEWR